MKYDSQITELKTILPGAKNILIALPVGADLDRLSAGLALFLILEAVGKQVSIVSDDAVLVGHSHLFGVDHIQKTLPSTEGGNLTLTLEGVAASNGTVPALEKLDWFAEGNNLNLVFHVLPGQIFQPARIIPRYSGSGFDLVITIGSANLNALGNIYTQNQNSFSGTHIANIDNQVGNSQFGVTNVLDTNSSSLSEIMINLIADLGFVLDADSASNLLAGIFDATNNLQDPKVTAETYMAVANCLRVGGKKPSVSMQTPNIQTQPTEISALPAQPAYDWNAVAAAINPKGSVQEPATQEFIVPQVAPTSVQIQPQVADDSQASPEERPMGEGVVSETVEPEWLTPKIFKGTSLG